jgi:hypothetical protein
MTINLVQLVLMILACYLIINDGVGQTVGFGLKLVKCVIVILIIHLIFNKLFLSEGFKSQDDYPVAVADRCRGGEYMHQGEGDLSRKCRDLIKSGSVNQCNKGFNNLPLAPFDYTSQSDDNFENKQCSK